MVEQHEVPWQLLSTALVRVFLPEVIVQGATLCQVGL
jgi:hypothetical protein